MRQEIIKSLTKDFESYSHKTKNGIEFWLARDLQHLLGILNGIIFLKVIFQKQGHLANLSNNNVSDHFAGVGKMVNLGSGSQREVPDIMLTRYACYLIAQNGDSSKKEIAFAQTYFAVQTRKFEAIEKKDSGVRKTAS